MELCRWLGLSEIGTVYALQQFNTCRHTALMQAEPRAYSSENAGAERCRETEHTEEKLTRHLPGGTPSGEVE